ncbi:mucoidy inhibitor MuiA family protein [Paludisphaera soli]|uniref:mucoidy inhibitor MuiA family protein n=1 Tax=Paludisphaera soli TaxID=2712865 RepID=UPI0013EB191A|nr:mucoidy inhibitor MuiA family protein [Paludisphaera soli]
MTAPWWLAAGLACAQLGGDPDGAKGVGDPAGGRATSRIAAVTVYRGQARVTREVQVPEGDGAVELIVGPLPPRLLEGSLFAEGSDGLRVVSARIAPRAAGDDARREAREHEQEVARLEAEEARLRKEAEVQEQDLQYLTRLEGFTGSSLGKLTDVGRLDSGAVVELSRFVMESREAKTKAAVDLAEQIRSNAVAMGEARSRLRGPTQGDAVLLVRRARPGGGTVRLGYLADSADWTPRYRLRGEGDKAPVVLEYLASLVQRTGEDWAGVAVRLSTADPSLDAAPPDLLPLKMAGTVGATDAESSDDEASRKVLAELRKPVDMRFPQETPLEDVLKYVRTAGAGPAFPEGLPLYVDPIGLNEADKTSTSPVTIDLAGVPLGTSLNLALKQIGLGWMVRGGVLQITSQEAIDQANHPSREDDETGMAGMAGMGGMGGGMGGLGADPNALGRRLNRAAAGEQAEELRVAEGREPAVAEEEAGGRDAQGVAFAIEGSLDVPSRPEAQLVEVARVELPAEYYAKAVPVLTSRVYRLARLTNTAPFTLLPGEVDVHDGGEFVGRMRMPLVAAGEPFVAGFGVDPQLQVARRLIRKSRTVQGGNQVLTYEFRLSLRNFRPDPVKVQLWDRLPQAEGESAAVSLVKTSAELSEDPLYQRAARLDNLLRWDVDLPPGTVGDKALYVTYEFRLEYARDLPPPRFESGGLKEAPIGGGAMSGGPGGDGRGFQTLRPAFE